MIKAVTVTNHLGESLRMDFSNPEGSGLLIYNIEGLGAPSANINTTDVATMDGALFNSAKLGTRNIVLSLYPLWKNTIEDARHLTYRYFPIKKKIKLEFETDNRTSYCYGYVESNEAEIFSELESIQISVICPNPYFYKSGDMELVDLSGTESLFEFPFSNESVTDNLLEMGEISPLMTRSVWYEGDIDIGVLITIHAVGAVRDISVYNSTTREIMTIDTDKIATITGQAFGNQDDIIISTVPGEKYVHLLRNGSYINIINAVDKNAHWFKLQNGDNMFAITAESGESNLQAKIQYRNAYQGV